MISHIESVTSEISSVASPTPRILVVDGDPVIRDLLEFILLRENFRVVTLGSGDEALEHALRHSPDLIVLDMVLPGLSGEELCKQIRTSRRFALTPVLILSAKSDEMDRVHGFELGADDYVTKPFGPRELVCRIRRLLRVQPAAETKIEVIKTRDLELDIPRHQAFADGKPLKLTAIEFRLLTTLVQRRGRVQSRERLLLDVWEYAKDLETRTVDTHMRRLRQKLGPARRCYLETVRGVGYCFR
jgi:two-component system phosphate regulon response regulator PhoB